MRTLEAAVAAMRERSSTAEVLALYEGGLVTAVEVVDAAWRACYDRPALQVELVRQFCAHPNEHIRDLVGGGLEQLAAQVSRKFPPEKGEGSLP